MTTQPQRGFNFGSFVKEYFFSGWILPIWLLLLSWLTLRYTIARFTSAPISTVIILAIWLGTLAWMASAAIGKRHTPQTYWIKENLYNSVTNVLISLLIVLFVVSIVLQMWQYGLVRATFNDVPLNINERIPVAEFNDPGVDMALLEAGESVLIPFEQNMFGVDVRQYKYSIDSSNPDVVIKGEEYVYLGRNLFTDDAGANWGAVRDNFANLMVFRFKEYSPRLWAVIGILIGLAIFSVLVTQVLDPEQEPTDDIYVPGQGSQQLSIWRLLMNFLWLMSPFVVWKLLLGSTMSGMINIILAGIMLFTTLYITLYKRQAVGVSLLGWIINTWLIYGLFIDGIVDTSVKTLAQSVGLGVAGSFGLASAIVFIIHGIFALLLIYNFVLPLVRGGERPDFNLGLGGWLMLGWIAVMAIRQFTPVIASAIYGIDYQPIEVVDPDQTWGGLLLTLIISLFAIVVSFPLGVLLALGRRSEITGVPKRFTYILAGVAAAFFLATSTPELLATSRNLFESVLAFWPLLIVILAYAFQRTFDGNVLAAFSTLFIEMVRGVPLITIIFMAIILFPIFLPPGTDINNTWRVMAGFTFFSAAYLAENVRGGLQALNKGQWEAADAVGLSGFQKYVYIIMPQALRAVIPSIVGQFIGLFKDTSLVFLVGLFDLLAVANNISGQPDWINVRTEPYLLLAVIFFFGSAIMAGYSRRLETQLGVGER